MSLETLLEAAEFLESRGKALDRQRHRNLSDRRTNSFCEVTAVEDEEENNDTEEKAVKEAKTKNKSGKLSPIYVGPPDSFFTCMRAGTREVHNKLEKNRKLTQRNFRKELSPSLIGSAHNWLERNRRAHLKECFDFLKKNIPSLEDKRISNLGILRSSLRYIQNLKRRERYFELEMQRFAQEKIMLQERMRGLKTELHGMDIDLSVWVAAATRDHDNETNSTSTATERGTPPPSDFDENDDDEEEAERLVLETNPSPTPKNIKTSGAAGVRPLVPIAIPRPPNPVVGGTVNGVVPKVNQILLKSPTTKKTIPITLSLSGPVQPVSYMANYGKVVADSGAVPASRTPVTQLLHRTLTQRQALMKQAAGSTAVSSAPLTIAQLKSPPLSHNIIPVSLATGNTTVSTVTPKLEPSSAPIPTVVGTSFTNISLSNKQGTSAAPGAIPVTLPYYMASVQKIAHPILVTSLMAPAVGLSTSTNSGPASGGPVGTSSALVSSLPPKTEIKLEPSTPFATQTVTPFNFLTAPVVTTPVTQTEVKTTSAAMPIRPIFAPNLLSGWPLLTTLPRSTVVVPSSSVAVTQTVSSLTTVASTATSIPLVSLAQINQLSQIMTPMTVMSPGIQMTQATINPSQLNTMFATSPLLKQILPLGIPSSLLQSGQVLGQVKPVVVVTVPNVVTQTPLTLNSVAIATTTS